MSWEISEPLNFRQMEHWHEQVCDGQSFSLHCAAHSQASHVSWPGCVLWKGYIIANAATEAASSDLFGAIGHYRDLYEC